MFSVYVRECVWDPVCICVFVCKVVCEWVCVCVCMWNNVCVSVFRCVSGRKSEIVFELMCVWNKERERNTTRTVSQQKNVTRLKGIDDSSFYLNRFFLLLFIFSHIFLLFEFRVKKKVSKEVKQDGW